MGTFFGAIIGWWLFIAFIASFYFWAKKTNPSQAPIERRFTAAGYGLAWPYFAYKAVKSKQEQGANPARHRAQDGRILGDAESSNPPPTPTPLDKQRRPVWLTLRGIEDDPDVRVYQVFAHRPSAERHGIVPWDVLPGTEQAASDYMTREKKLVETIGITRDGKWLAFSHNGEMVKWFLRCQQPSVPEAGGATDGRSQQSPEGEGFSEGDRVRLAKPFWGELDPDTGTLLQGLERTGQRGPADVSGPKSGNHHLPESSASRTC